MTEYFVRVAILLPLIGGLAWGSLWLWKRSQSGFAFGPKSTRVVSVVDVVPLGAAGRLAVVAFGGRHLLVSVSKTGVSVLDSDVREASDARD